MNSEPITTSVITRTSEGLEEKWTFAMEDKSYSLCLLAYGRYVRDKNIVLTEAFFHPWQVDRSAQLNIKGDQVPVPEDVLKEAKQSLLERLGYSDIDLPEDVKEKAAVQFLNSIKFAIAEAPIANKPDFRKRSSQPWNPNPENVPADWLNV
jgi:hypothetical protein